MTVADLLKRLSKLHPKAQVIMHHHAHTLGKRRDGVLGVTIQEDLDGRPVVHLWGTSHARPPVTPHVRIEPAALKLPRQLKRKPGGWDFPVAKRRREL